MCASVDVSESVRVCVLSLPGSEVVSCEGLVIVAAARWVIWKEGKVIAGSLL